MTISNCIKNEARINMRRAVAIAIILISTVFSSPLLALELLIQESASKSPNGESDYWLTMTGEIDVGDYEKVLNVVLEKGIFPSQVIISSNGGSVLDAMKVGRLFRSAYLTVSTMTECHSACILIWLAAAERRTTVTQFGIHRPYYNPEYFANLSLSEAEVKYKKLDHDVADYMAEMGAPTSLIDKMMSIKSTDGLFLRGEALEDIVGTEAKAYQEWAIAKCGELDDYENVDWEKVVALKMYEAAVEMMKESGDDKKNHELASGMAEYSRKNAEVARTLPQEYRNKLKEKVVGIQNCKREGIKQEQATLIEKLKAGT